MGTIHRGFFGFTSKIKGNFTSRFWKPHTSIKTIIKALGNGRVTPPESLMDRALSALTQTVISAWMCRSKAIPHKVSFNLAELVPKKPAKAQSQHHSYSSEERLKGTESHVGTP